MSARQVGWFGKCGNTVGRNVIKRIGKASVRCTKGRCGVVRLGSASGDWMLREPTFQQELYFVGKRASVRSVASQSGRGISIGDVRVLSHHCHQM